MRSQKRLWQLIGLAILLLLAEFVAISNFRRGSAQVSNSPSSQDVLLQYEWPQFMGDSHFSRFSAGPAPATSNILWKNNITGIQPYISAFNGMIFVCTTTSVIALEKETGDKLWEQSVPMNGTWPIVYKVDETHMIVEGTCLDPKTGHILWTSSDFSADSGGIFNSNVYSHEEKMFYVKDGSYIEAWDFADPSHAPTLVWKSYVRGGGTTGSGTTYGDGKVFPGSFENLQMALDAKTGDVLWSTLTKGPMIFTGSYYQDRFLRGGTDDNTLYCFNATDGAILWTYKPSDEGYFATGTAVAYGMVYSPNKDGNLYAVDIETGDLAWKYQGPGPLLFPGNPTVADGKVYCTTGQAAQFMGLVGYSEFACVNAYSGRVLWKLPIEALAPRESVAVAYGHLYMIPGNVTTSVDTISGGEYATVNEVWAFGTTPIPVSDWPMWRADPTHSSTGQAGPSNLSMAWKFTTGGSIISSPSVVNGIVYVGSQDKNIYALGAWGGNLIWKFTTLDAVESSPSVANGKVYTGGDDGYVYCLDAYTGALNWKTFVNGDLPFTFGSIVLKSSPVVVEGVVYIGSLDGCMYALDASNGNIVWRTITNGPIESSPAVADGAVFFTSEEPTEGALFKLNALTGDVIWKTPIPYEYQFTGGHQLLGSPSVANGMVFASSDLSTYYAVNATSGKVSWTFKDPAATEFIISSPIYVNGSLYIIDKFNIACLDATNGSTIWSAFTGDELYVSPSYADGKIYVVTSQRHLYVLDALNSGAKIADITSPSSCWSSPTVANGKVYLGCNDWNVYCYSVSITNEVVPPPSNIGGGDGFLLTVGVVVVLVVSVAVVVGYVVVKYKRRKPAP